MVIPANIPTVLRKSFTANSFLPSRYNRNGCKQNRYPITAAESTKSERNITGIIRDDCRACTFDIVLIITTINTMYVLAAKALYIGFLVISKF